MSHVDLGNDLTLTDIPEGVILQWVQTDTAVVDAFIVSMSLAALRILEKALEAPGVRWTDEDGRLTVSGDTSSLLMTFQMQEPPCERMALRLDETEARRFRKEISKRAGTPEP